MNLPRHTRSQGGWAKPFPPIEMASMIKIITTKLYVFSVSVSLCIFAYNSIRVQQTNINNQVGGLRPSNQNFAIQFKGTVGAAYYDDG